MAQSSLLPETEHWQLVNARLREEAREVDMDTKLTQLASLMASVDEGKLEREEARGHIRRGSHRVR